MRIYEGMFVLDDGRSNSNWDGVVREVRGLLEKHRAEVFTCERWDERRLAYPIRGRHRGVYLLTRFTAPAGAIAPIQRDCELNDTILRVLIVRDAQTEKLHKAGLFPPQAEEPAAEEPQPPESGDTAAPSPPQAAGQPPAGPPPGEGATPPPLPHDAQADSGPP